MLSEFTQDVIRVLRSIPSGKVLAYGDAAVLAGNPRAARTISWILNSASEKYGLPWHRVVNAKGGLSLQGEGGALQRSLLEAEGIRFDAEGRIDMDVYRWNGNAVL